jgi:hypothetical protein
LSFCGPAFGVGNEVQPLPDVRRPDARSRQTRSPEPVTFSFQVSLNKVEPAVSNCSFNLFPNNNWRSALADEVMEGRPQVALVVESVALSGDAERLTRT